MRKFLPPVLGAAIAVALSVAVAHAQPTPGFSKTYPLTGTGTATNPLRLTLCAASQILKMNAGGTAYECAADAGGGGVTDGNKGDITVSSSGATWTVNNDAVTYAKMQDVSATNRIMCRRTAGAGNMEECTASEANTILGTPTGSGTTNIVPKWTGASTLGNSSITDTGTGVTTTLPFGALTVADNGNRVFSIAGAGLTSTGPTVDVVGTTNSITVNANSIELASRDFGDITVGSTGTTMTVDNDAITYAKMQNVVNNNRFLGRISGAGGDPEEITGTQATALLDLASTSATTKGLVPGANSAGTGAYLRGDLTWQTAPWLTCSGCSTNYLTRWNGSALVNSQVFDNGTDEVKVGSGADAATRADATLIATLNGDTSISVRNSTNDTEFVAIAGGSNVSFGSQTNTNVSLIAAGSAWMTYTGSGASILDHLSVTGNTTAGDADSDYLNARGTLAFSGTDPTITSGSCTIAGEAQSFRLTKTVGGSGTCVVNLGRTFNSAPYCTVLRTTTKTADVYQSAETTSSVTFVIGDDIAFNVHCPDRR